MQNGYNFRYGIKGFNTRHRLFLWAIVMSNRVKNLDKQVVIEQFGHSVTGDKPTGFAGFQSLSLVLESSTALRVYYGYEQGVGAGRFGYQIDGEKATMIKTGSGLYYMEITGIAAKDLDTWHVFTITGGKKPQPGLRFY